MTSMTPAATHARHEPHGYQCPFCVVTAGGETAVNSQGDVVARNEYATALVSPRWWPRNHGHVLVISNYHHENLYDLPRHHGHAIQDLVRDVAIAIRDCYGCEGVSIRQHNEPAGDQEVWHYHAHVFPRFSDDGLYSSDPLPDFVSAAARKVYADTLREFFADRAVNADGQLCPQS